MNWGRKREEMKKILFSTGIVIILSFVPLAGASLIGYWDFNETVGLTVYDSSPNGYDGVINGAVRVQGISGNALHFDGIDDLVIIPDSQNVDIRSAITIESWLKFDKLPVEGLQSIITKWKVGARSFHLQKDLDAHQNQYRIYLFADGDPIFVDLLSDTPAELNKWTHVATTYDGNVAKIYLNGNLDSFQYASGLIQQGGSNIEFGGESEEASIGYPIDFHGTLDEVRIYSHALTRDEIRADMNAGIPSGVPELSSLFLLGLSLIVIGLRNKFSRAKVT